MDNLDTNIDNWSIDDILELLNLNNPTASEVEKTANKLIKNAEEQNNDIVSNFLKEAKEKVIKSAESDEEEDSFAEKASNQLLNWRGNEFLEQSDNAQADKVTSRFNKVQIFDDNDDALMKRERIGVNQDFNVPVMQGTINPNLKNMIEKTVIIDSQYRPNIFPYANCDISQTSFNTNFSIDLSESLPNALSMQLYSATIPRTWYNISMVRGNYYFYIIDATSTGKIKELIALNQGNYTIQNLNDAINEKVNHLGLVFDYDPITNKVGISGNRGSTYKIVWYFEQQKEENDCNCINTVFINNNLGWTLGFRQLSESNPNELSNIIENGEKISADASPNLAGPQYLLLAVDDYQNNRPNDGVLGIGDIDTKLNLPDYTSADNSVCVGDTAFYVETAPRRLTKKQLYTINTINQNRKEAKTRQAAPTNDNVLAVIPIPNTQSNSLPNDGSGQGTTSVASNGSFVSYTGSGPPLIREYFGPVNIERLGVSLYDDVGNLIDLNGTDWSFILKIKLLYQY